MYEEEQKNPEYSDEKSFEFCKLFKNIFLNVKIGRRALHLLMIYSNCAAKLLKNIQKTKSDPGIIL